MSAARPAWEEHLLALATEGLTTAESWPEIAAGSAALERAFRECDRITARHSRTFHFASSLLPREKRRGARALYAFCRRADDIVDEGGGDAEEKLAHWRERALAPRPAPHDPVPLAWAATRARFRIPARYAHQLIDGVGLDLSKTRYASFGELAQYCYGVASTVGLMSMHIIGFKGSEAIPYAVKMGVALQLTNILRDVGEDWRRGRLYLPQDELAAAKLDEAAVAAGRVDDRWREFTRGQIARTRRLYDESWPGIAWLHRDGQFAIAAAADLYRAILEDLEANDYDNFHHRAHISSCGKLRRLPGIWLRLRRLRRHSPERIVPAGSD